MPLCTYATRSRRIDRPQLRPRTAARDAPDRLRGADVEAVLLHRSLAVGAAGGGEAALDDAGQVVRDVGSVFADGVEGHRRADEVQRDEDRRDKNGYPRSSALASSHSASISSSVS